MTTPTPQAHVIPAWSGWRCLLQAGDLIGQRWPVYLQVILLWAAISLLFGMLPGGQLLLPFMLVLLQGGVALMFHQQLQQARLQPKDLFQMLRHPCRNTLLVAMLLLLLVVMVLVAIMMMPFAELLQQLAVMRTLEELLAAELPAEQLFWLLSAATLLISFLTLLWFFAVPRIVFDLLPAAAALSDSLRACVRNWRALLTYGLASVVIASAAMFLLVMVSVIPNLLLGDAAAIAFTSLLAMGMTSALQVLGVGGVYLLWRQVYPRAADDALPAAEERTRFLA